MNCGRLGRLMAFQYSGCLTDQTLRWQRRLRVRLFVNSYFSASMNIRTRGVQATITIRICAADARGNCTPFRPFLHAPTLLPPALSPPPSAPCRPVVPLQRPLNFTPTTLRATFSLMSTQLHPPMPGAFVYLPVRQDIQTGIIMLGHLCVNWHRFAECSC